MRCIKWYSTLAILFFCLPFSANTESQQTVNNIENKLASYSQLVATAIFHWNLESNVSNQDIIELLQLSGLQEDNTQEATVFRHLLATYSANDVGDAKIPIFVKKPLLKADWLHLRTLSLPLYAAAKAYYIFSKNANNFESTALRVKYSVPELYELKTELFDFEEPKAIAIASIWLAMEMSLANPINAISEIEYALPHLPENSKVTNLENYLSKSIAHEWLRAIYVELSVPSEAYNHAMAILESTGNPLTKAWAYFSAIDTLIIQNNFSQAMELSDQAMRFVESKNSQRAIYLILVQRLRIVAFAKTPTRAIELTDLHSKINNLNESKIRSETEELVTYYYALKYAMERDEKAFRSAVSDYKNALQNTQNKSDFESDISLVGELELSRLYEVFGDNDLAYHHLKNYNAILVKKNSEQFKVNDASFANSILKDIELARFRREELNELRAERLGLSEDNEQKTNTIYLLIVVIAAILLIWRRIAGNQKAKSNSAR